ncbi:50S ribosomal protein L29 [Mycoplasmatota bacterium]|nr:50S ribosomal protein L29 [Mycoplasmatota bacterium]
MKANEIRKMNTTEIEKEIVNLKKELFDLRFQAAVGQLENTARLSKIKKDIARMYTIVTEREKDIRV